MKTALKHDRPTHVTKDWTQRYSSITQRPLNLKSHVAIVSCPLVSQPQCAMGELSMRWKDSCALCCYPKNLFPNHQTRAHYAANLAADYAPIPIIHRISSLTPMAGMCCRHNLPCVPRMVFVSSLSRADALSGAPSLCAPTINPLLKTCSVCGTWIACRRPRRSTPPPAATALTVVVFRRRFEGRARASKSRRGYRFRREAPASRSMETIRPMRLLAVN